MYTVKEVAKIMGVADLTVRRWMYKGLIKYVKIGTTVRIAEEEVERIKKGKKGK